VSEEIDLRGNFPELHRQNSVAPVLKPDGTGLVNGRILRRFLVDKFIVARECYDYIFHHSSTLHALILEFSWKSQW
jgi:hypothetical protein